MGRAAGRRREGCRGGGRGGGGGAGGGGEVVRVCFMKGGTRRRFLFVSENQLDVSFFFPFLL